MRIHVGTIAWVSRPKYREALLQLGFTTKPEGSGIVLQSSANVAQQLGGAALSWHSDGPGCGARFTLELPMTPAPLPRRPTSQPSGDDSHDPHAGTIATT